VLGKKHKELRKSILEAMEEERRKKIIIFHAISIPVMSRKQSLHTTGTTSW
jgi:hypothetical protein